MIVGRDGMAAHLSVSGSTALGVVDVLPTPGTRHFLAIYKVLLTNTVASLGIFEEKTSGKLLWTWSAPLAIPIFDHDSFGLFVLAPDQALTLTNPAGPAVGNVLNWNITFEVRRVAGG